MATNIDLHKMVLALANKNKIGTITPEIFLQWVNMAQEDVVDEKLPLIDGSSRIVADLLPLKTVDKSATITSGKFSIDGTHKKISHVKIVLVKSGVSYYPRVIFLPDNRKNEVLTSNYNKPSERVCYYSFSSATVNSTLTLYVNIHVPDGYTPTVTYDYYKTPDAVTMTEVNGAITLQTLVWNKSMCNEIARRTVVMYLESIGDQRYQTLKTEQLSQNNKQ